MTGCTKLLWCEFGDMRILLGCQSNLTGAKVNLYRTLPEVPQTFVRSSYGRLFKVGAPGFGFGTSDPG